jgi:hypothetical protein
MAPRLHNIRWRYDAAWYDTSVDHRPGQTVPLFGDENIGNEWLTNLTHASQLSHDDTAVVCGVGLRIPHATIDEEDRLLDYFRVRLWSGRESNNTYRMLAPWCGADLSTLRRHVENPDLLSAATIWPRIRWVARQNDCPFEIKDAETCLAAMDWLEENSDARRGGRAINGVTQREQLGYRLVVPIVVAVRQPMGVIVAASPDLPEPKTVRVTLFGVGSKDVP